MLDGAGARAASPKTVPKGCARRRQFRAANKAAKHPGFSVPEPLPFGTVFCRISELGGLTRFTGFCGARPRARRTLLNAKDFGGYFRVSRVLVVPALQEFPRGGRVDLRALGVSDVFGNDRKLDRLVIGLVPIAGDHTLSPPRSIDLAHALGIFASSASPKASAITAHASRSRSRSRSSTVSSAQECSIYPQDSAPLRYANPPRSVPSNLRRHLRAGIRGPRQLWHR